MEYNEHINHMQVIYFEGIYLEVDKGELESMQFIVISFS